MNNNENLSGLKLLRAPFLPHQISKLPKPYKKDSPKGNCAECGGYHGLPAVHLDYVGHAALTDRLLDVDPNWTWEPVAFDSNTGLPKIDNLGGLWIKLTICGVTRLGYGHADTALEQFDGDCVKECIGDALRNGAMRFGAALNLWHKGDLHKEPEQEIDPLEYIIQLGDKNKLTGTKIKDHNLADLSVSLEKTLDWYKTNKKTPHTNVIQFQKMLEKAIALSMK